MQKTQLNISSTWRRRNFNSYGVGSRFSGFRLGCGVTDDDVSELESRL